jgi:hypothetical protein
LLVIVCGRGGWRDQASTWTAHARRADRRPRVPAPAYAHPALPDGGRPPQSRPGRGRGDDRTHGNPEAVERRTHGRSDGGDAGVYGDALRERCQELFGDGILSAIDCVVKLEKEGERGLLTIDAKFLHYKEF